MSNLYRVLMLATMYGATICASSPSDKVAVFKYLNAQSNHLVGLFQEHCKVEYSKNSALDQYDYKLNNINYCKKLIEAIEENNAMIEEKYDIKRYDHLATKTLHDAMGKYRSASDNK